MQARYLLFLVAFLSTILFISTDLLAQQKPDSTSIIDTTTIIASADSTTIDKTQRANDSLLIAQKKNQLRTQLHLKN